VTKLQCPPEFHARALNTQKRSCVSPHFSSCCISALRSPVLSLPKCLGFQVLRRLGFALVLFAARGSLNAVTLCAFCLSVPALRWQITTFTLQNQSGEHSEVTGWVRKRFSTAELPSVNNFYFTKDCWMCLKEPPESCICGVSAPRILKITGKILFVYAMVLLHQQ